MKTPITDAKTFDLTIHGDAYHDRVEYPDGMGDLVDADHCRAIERAANGLAEAIRRDDQVLMAEALAAFEALKPTTQKGAQG